MIASDSVGYAQLTWLYKVRWCVIVVQLLSLIPGWYLGFVHSGNILSYLVVDSLLVLANLIAFGQLRSARYIKESHVFGHLSFDFWQLNVLIAMTGGWNNPFNSFFFIHLLFLLEVISM